MPEPRMPEQPSRYLVFARDDFERALECAGEVEAPDEETARESALRQRRERGGGELVEMVLVPVAAAHWIVRPASDEQPARTGSGT